VIADRICVAQKGWWWSLRSVSSQPSVIVVVASRRWQLREQSEWLDSVGHRQAALPPPLLAAWLSLSPALSSLVVVAAAVATALQVVGRFGFVVATREVAGVAQLACLVPAATAVAVAVAVALAVAVVVVVARQVQSATQRHQPRQEPLALLSASSAMAALLQGVTVGQSRLRGGL